jgi:adenylosuccinate synthase
VTKLDVLTGFPVLKVAVAYKCGASELKSIPPELAALEACQPVYEEFPGWEEDIRDVRRFDDLPANTKRYLRAIEELSGTPLSIVSVGPGRDETIVVKHPFES